MASFNVSITGISAEMLGALADLAEREWGDTELLDIVAVADGNHSAQPLLDAVEVAVPSPVPATSAIEVVIPPEPIDDFTEPMPTPTTSRKRG